MNTKVLFLLNGWAGKNHLLDNVMIFCASYLIYLIFIIAVGAVAYLVYKRQWRPVVLFCTTLIITFIFLQLASRLYVDHRPFVDYRLTQLVAHAAGTSFPSDHTTATTAIALGLLLFTRFKKMGMLVLIAAVLIGIARVFCGIHYPVDIIGALITGLLGASIVYMVNKAFHRFYQIDSEGLDV